MNVASRRVAVVGAGYAGLAAAVELARAGVHVTVFEAGRTLGGRARVVEKDGYRLDNGQHILIGAYTETLALLRSLGVKPKALHSEPFTLHVPGRLHLQAGALPAPFHLLAALLRCRELSWDDRLALIRFMRHLKRCRYSFKLDHTVTELLIRTRQTALLRELVWEPLCVAALNTPANEASAQVFATVLRDTLGGSATASELLIPRIDLSELLPVPAVLFLSRHGCPVHTATPVKAIERLGEGFSLEGDPNPAGRYDAVVCAVAPYHASALLAGFPELTLLREQIDSLPHEPISTVYLAYDEPLRLPQPMIGLAHSVVQWLFDRGQLGGPAGLFAGVISARGPHTELPREELALRAHQAVEQLYPRTPAPKWSTVITEKRATFACRPGVLRPLGVTPVRNLVLAGDYIESPYPATLETAVRSGLDAARRVLRTLAHA